MFDPPLENVTFFHSKLCKFHIEKEGRLVLQKEGKTNFSRRLKQFGGLM